MEGQESAPETLHLFAARGLHYDMEVLEQRKAEAVVPRKATYDLRLLGPLPPQ